MTCQNAGACEKRIQEPQIQDSPLPTLDVKACCFASVPRRSGKGCRDQHKFALKLLKANIELCIALKQLLQNPKP